VMNEANEVRSEKKANEGAPFSPFHLWCPEWRIELENWHAIAVPPPE
jgi:hypothetical protein